MAVKQTTSVVVPMVHNFETHAHYRVNPNRWKRWKEAAREAPTRRCEDAVREAGSEEDVREAGTRVCVEAVREAGKRKC